MPKDQDEGVSMDDLRDVDPKSEYKWDLSRIRVGKKKVVFEADKSWNGPKKVRIAFSKYGQACRGDELEINVEQEEIVLGEPRKVKCNLGHEHEEKEESMVKRDWGRVRLSWEHVEQLIEWLQLGSWTEVKKK